MRPRALVDLSTLEARALLSRVRTWRELLSAERNEIGRQLGVDADLFGRAARLRMRNADRARMQSRAAELQLEIDCYERIAKALAYAIGRADEEESGDAGPPEDHTPQAA